MREIKFRAWDKRKNKWIEQESLVINNGLLYEDWRDFEDGEPLSNDDAELVEYTGLKDKNGIGICEGDILSYFGFGYEVVFEKSAFGWYEGGEFYSFAEMAIEEIARTNIIGNRYENSELLDAKP